MSTTQPEPRCYACAHYHITHDPAFPYGCRAMGFKSRIEPRREVLRASGEECRYFEPGRRGQAGPERRR